MTLYDPIRPHMTLYDLIWPYTTLNDLSFQPDAHIESDTYDYDSDSSSHSRVIIHDDELTFGSNSLHILTVGGEQYMVQLWIENKIFQIRIVSEKEHESPGILAKDCFILDGQS